MVLKGVRQQKGCSKYSYRLHFKLPNGKEVSIEKGGYLTAEEAYAARQEKLIELTTQDCNSINKTFSEVFYEFIDNACIDKDSLKIKYNTYYNSYLNDALGSLLIGDTLDALKGLQKKLCKSVVSDRRSSTKQIYLSQSYITGLKVMLFNLFDYAYNSGYINQHPMYQLDDWVVYNKKENKNIEPLFAYLGNKHRILPNIQELFPKDIKVFVDLFGGSGVVGINATAEKIIINDNNLFLIGILKGIQSTTPADAWRLAERIIFDYSLNKDNEDGYYTCRSEYNKIEYEKRCLDYWYWGLVLVWCSFNRSTVQFNGQYEYNAPFGYNKVNFELAKRKFFMFAEKVYNSSIDFTCEDYKDILIPKDAFLYLDPPYSITTATYNKFWNSKEEQDLYKYLEDKDAMGIKWAMSNVLENNGIRNRALYEWVKSNNFNLYYLKSNYIHANFRRKNKGRTVEVLITNY